MRLIRKFFVVLMTCIVLLSAIPISSAFAYSGGLLNGKTMVDGIAIGTPHATAPVSYTKLTDNDEATQAQINYYSSSHHIVMYNFASPVSISSYKLKGSGSLNVIWKKTDGTINRFNAVKTGVQTNITELTNVAWIGVENTSGDYAYVNEFDVFTPPDLSPPAVPTGLTGTSQVESVQLNWDANTSDTSGYNVYQNGVKKNTQLITTNSFIVQNVTPDINYTYEITASDDAGNESNKSSSVTLKAMLPIEYPILNYENLTYQSVKLIWDNVAPTYEIYKDGVKIATTEYQYNNITNLEANTSYDFYVIGIDKYGRNNQSNTLQLLTLPLIPVTPNISVSEKTSSSFKISWPLDPNTINYSIFLNGNLVGTITDVFYTFNSLTPDTIYSFKVVANGDTENEESSGSARTEPLPVPKIDNANLSLVPDQPTKRNLSYSANEHVTAVKVYVDGQLIGEYPVSQNVIELDFATIQDAFADIKIEPVDENGQPYEFKGFTKSTGEENIDNLLFKFFDGFLSSKNAFWYMALCSIPVIAGVVIYFFLRRKFKHTFGETKKEAATLINQPAKPFQETIDVKEEKRKFVPWKEMTEEQKNEWREKKGVKAVRGSFTESDRLKNISDRHEKKTGFKIVEQKVTRHGVGFLGMGGTKTKVNSTYERNGVQYKQNHVRGQGMVYQPKDLKNKVKHVSNQFKAVKSAFTGSNKKFK